MSPAEILDKYSLEPVAASRTSNEAVPSTSERKFESLIDCLAFASKQHWASGEVRIRNAPDIEIRGDMPKDLIAECRRRGIV